MAGPVLLPDAIELSGRQYDLSEAVDLSEKIDQIQRKGAGRLPLQSSDATKFG